MIVIKLEGRLGNQLFQYAFAHAISKKLGISFYLDKSIEPFLLSKYFEVENDILHIFDKHLFSIKGFKNFFTYYLRKGFYKSLKWLLRLKEISISEDTELSKVKDHSILNGYFQSAAYFDSYAQDILKLFRIKCRYKTEFDTLITSLNIQQPIIAVHIRRTDYIGLNMALPLSYFEKALTLYNSEKYFVVFISDDPSFVKKEFSYIKSKYISTHSEIIDLQFLINADVCILSNSSFSWWGAYLNPNNPTVIAPKYWMGFEEKTEMPKDIILPNWIKLEF